MRGEGVYKKIREALANLREAGVPFGIQVTATSKNYEILLTDEFYKYYFEEMGATHMWQYQLMPDALQSEFFKNGRKWQKDKGFAKTNHQGEYLVMPQTYVLGNYSVR